LGAATKTSALAAFDGRIVRIKVQQRTEAILPEGVDPIDDDGDRIEPVPSIRHGPFSIHTPRRED
jgi:hypothetical protein